MSIWLTEDDLRLTRPAERAFESPIPTRVVSNGEYMPPPQTPAQARVAAEIRELARSFAPRLGLSRREFLRTSSGMAMAFLCMNRVYGAVFDVNDEEARDPEAAAERDAKLSGQPVFDAQLHFVREDYPGRGILGLRQLAVDRDWNPELPDREPKLSDIQFENFMQEVFMDSDTSIGILSSAPNDDPDHWFIDNDQAARARQKVNDWAGSKRLLAHAVIVPGQPGWRDEVDRAIEELKPDSWKGYTLGDPGGGSNFPWRLDDEELMYPAYEKMQKAGIRNICIHKGLVPPDYERAMPELWVYASVDDVGKAAQDWPGLNFIIYHSALANLAFREGDHLARFESSGRMPWVSDLAEIPGKFDVENVYAEIGTSFATSVISHPGFCGAMLGTLIDGMGHDHVIWGTDSVWYGSPQWQIEALRRLEIPEDLREKHGFAPLGPADGEVKRMMFAGNSARMYGIDVAQAVSRRDRLAARKAEYRAAGAKRSNLAYGYVRR
ncbi:MAG: amidohydrolase family protein [Gammaproteobacteria bacterium]